MSTIILAFAAALGLLPLATGARANPPCELTGKVANDPATGKALRERRRKELIETWAKEKIPDQDHFDNYGNYFFTLNSNMGKRIFFESIVKIRGQVVTLEEIGIFPEGGSYTDASRVPIGPRETVRMFREIGAEAKTSGFKVLVLKGERITGANPGKYVYEVLDLTTFP